jgi:CDP-glycerol glycerophosphotransferase (TagB/SpsB family)
VLYAPTWTRFSSLNVMGEELVRRLVDAGLTVLVKLHDHSLNRNFESSGDVDWLGRLMPILAKGRGRLITSGDASPWLVAADVLITDHSSIGFEYFLLDRPVVRIAMPELIQRTDIPDEYVQLLASASTTVETPSEVVAAVTDAASRPRLLSAVRRGLVAELFHEPGNATRRAVDELYSLMELDPPICAQPVGPMPTVACAGARSVSR